MYKWWIVKYYFGSAGKPGVVWGGGKVDMRTILVAAHDEDEAKRNAKIQIEYSQKKKGFNIFSAELDNSSEV